MRAARALCDDVGFFGPTPGLFQDRQGGGVNVDNVNMLVSDEHAARIMANMRRRWDQQVDELITDRDMTRQVELLLSKRVGAR